MNLFRPIFCCFLICTSLRAQQLKLLTGLPFLDPDFGTVAASWIDVDNDRDLDVCLTGFKGLPGGIWRNDSRIYLNDGAANFVKSTYLDNSPQKTVMRHGWADYDNDGDLDIFVAATWNFMDVNELRRNDLPAGFTTVNNNGLPLTNPEPYEGTVSWADYDNDGLCDLFLPRWNQMKNRLFHNEGGGNFKEITNSALSTDPAWNSGGFWGDFNNDNRLDLFVVKYQIGSSAKGVNDLFRNEGNGVFSKVSAGPVTSTAQNGRSANWADVNNDGLLDLFLCVQFGQDQLYFNRGDGTFKTLSLGTQDKTSWSSNFGDFDNDGDLDLFTLGFQPSETKFYKNNGQGDFTDVSGDYQQILQFNFGFIGSNNVGAVWVDYDENGSLDLHVTETGSGNPPVMLKNTADECNAWLEIDCKGTVSNRAAIGAVVRAKARIDGNPVWQMRQLSAQSAACGILPFRQHFGFKNASIIDSLTVTFPSGTVCTFTNVAVNQLIEIREDCSLTVLKSFPPPQLTTSQTELTLCPPLTDTLLQSDSPSGGFWSADCGNCVDQNGLFKPQNLPPGQYVATYRQGGVCGTLDSFVVRIGTPPQLVVSNDTTVFKNEKVALKASGALQYSWTKNKNLTCTECPDPVFTADTTTLFYVTGTSPEGCIDRDSVWVKVEDKPGFSMPNAFTPNGDLVNDTFKPFITGKVFTEYRLRIYNRWGGLVFDTDNPEEGWDGATNGLDPASDVYSWLLEYTLTDGSSHKKAGDVTLLR